LSSVCGPLFIIECLFCSLVVNVHSVTKCYTVLCFCDNFVRLFRMEIITDVVHMRQSV